MFKAEVIISIRADSVLKNKAKIDHKTCNKAHYIKWTNHAFFTIGYNLQSLIFHNCRMKICFLTSFCIHSCWRIGGEDVLYKNFCFASFLNNFSCLLYFLLCQARSLLPWGLFSRCGEWALPLVVLCRLLMVVAYCRAQALWYGFRQFLHVDSLPVVHRLSSSTAGGIIPDLVSNLAPTLPAEFFTMEPEKHCLAFYNGFPTEQI